MFVYVFACAHHMLVYKHTNSFSTTSRLSNTGLAKSRLREGPILTLKSELVCTGLMCVCVLSVCLCVNILVCV